MGKTIPVSALRLRYRKDIQDALDALPNGSTLQAMADACRKLMPRRTYWNSTIEIDDTTFSKERLNAWRAERERALRQFRAGRYSEAKIVLDYRRWWLQVACGFCDQKSSRQGHTIGCILCCHLTERIKDLVATSAWQEIRKHLREGMPPAIAADRLEEIVPSEVYDTANKVADLLRAI